MSTKIYNGYKLKNKPKNLKEIRDILFKFKEEAIKYYRKKYYGLIAKDIVYIFDDAILTNKVFYDFPDRFDTKKTYKIQDESKTRSIWGMVSEAVDTKADIFREQHDRFHDFCQYEFYCNVTVLPCHDEVFLMIFTEEREVEDIFGKMEEIEEYPYWDNTDQPKGMTWEEWEVRGKEWDEALGNGIPSQNGFGIDILKETFDLKIFPKDGQETPSPLEETLKYIPNLEKRIKRLLSMKMRYLWKKDKRKEIDELLASDLGNYAMWQESDKMYKTWIKDNEELKESERKNISNMIKKSFTVEDLDMTAEDFIKKYNIKECESNENNSD